MVPGTLVDSHCHLQQLSPEERQAALEDARRAGVGGFLVPAVRLDEAEDLLALCHRHADVWCALGVHPHEAANWRPGDGERLRRLLADPRAVAVGECGLDFHYDHSPRAAQIEALRAQWSIALELGLPAVVHNRESDAEMLRQVRDPRFAGLLADFHSFAGGEPLAGELLGRGFYFGVSGMVTFARADNVRAFLARVPEDRLLVETDTPYLAPAPHRGRPNRPAWLVAVAERVASERRLGAARFAELSTANFFRLFTKARPAPAS
jgi:TatD DNase family protein